MRVRPRGSPRGRARGWKEGQEGIQGRGGRGERGREKEEEARVRLKAVLKG